MAVLSSCVVLHNFGYAIFSCIGQELVQFVTVGFLICLYLCYAFLVADFGGKHIGVLEEGASNLGSAAPARHTADGVGEVHNQYFWRCKKTASSPKDSRGTK
jgi:hypothetical protein